MNPPGQAHTSEGQLTIRVQFQTNISYPAHGQMFLTGSLPQLTNWGSGCCMKSSLNSWQYDIEIEIEPGCTKVIEFQYMYNLVRSSTSRSSDVMESSETASPVWQSRISRCKLHLSKLLDHIKRNNKTRTDASSSNVKVVVQVTGVESYPDTELFIVGTNPKVGDLDIKNARLMKKIDTCKTYHSTIYIDPSTSFSFWFSLIRKSGLLFNGNTASFSDEEAKEEEPAIVWNSGIGVVARPASISTVVHLLDNWDFAIGPCPSVAANLIPVSAPSIKGDQSNDKIDSRLSCKICWEEEAQTAFIPCGHAGTCWRCSTKVKKCPICRSHISKAIRIYF